MVLIRDLLAVGRFQSPSCRAPTYEHSAEALVKELLWPFGCHLGGDGLLPLLPSPWRLAHALGPGCRQPPVPVASSPAEPCTHLPVPCSACSEGGRESGEGTALSTSAVPGSKKGLVGVRLTSRSEDWLNNGGFDAQEAIEHQGATVFGDH